MARSRNIKPGLFKNEILGEADPLLTLLFEGLWCLADREGRLENRPRRIKAETFPYREFDVSIGLQWLMDKLFIVMYEVDGEQYIQVNNWEKHQNPHHKEVPSIIPCIPKKKAVKKPSKVDAQVIDDSCMTIPQGIENGSYPTDSLNLIPDSLNADSGQADSDESGAQEEIKLPPKRFQKPTLSELIAEFNVRVTDPMSEANKFLNYYESNGWKVGKNKMVSWTHAVTGWITRMGEDMPPPQNTIIEHAQDRSWAGE
jgi:hypothetical protein